MNLEQAIANMKAMYVQFKGTLAEHQAIQESLKVLEALLVPKEEEKKESEK